MLCTNDLPSDRLPEAVSRFLADRIAELQTVVNTLTPADLYPAWAEHVATSAAPRRPTPDLGAVGPDDQLVIADDPPVRIVHDQTSLRLYYRDTRVDLDPRALPLVTRLCDQRRFQVGDVISWYGPDREPDIRRVLSALTTSGILHRAL